MFVSAKVICISTTACALEIMDSELGARKFCFDYIADEHKLEFLHFAAAQLHHEWQKKGNTPIQDPPVLDSDSIRRIQQDITADENKPVIVEEKPVIEPIEVIPDASKE